MKPEEKNNLYHNILSVIRDEASTNEVKARDITLYIEQLLLKQQQEFEERQELYGEGSTSNMPPPKFGKTFKRVV